jgi:aspartate kinase|tara:strand:- start:2643 stop:3890 length:1248 start_codon:yes stop_codon:yes gene_type:complete
MSLIVQKFGGTSVGNVAKIQNVAKKVAAEIKKKNKVIVVVSAMSGVTNQLIGYCNEVSELKNNEELAEYDSIISSGEQVTSGLLALELQRLGCKARSFSGWQIKIKTDDRHSKARINSIGKDILLKELEDKDVVVVAGFQGINIKTERISTLGRGGSDTTAVAIAAAVKADICEIYTDVDGVFTTDPRIVDEAKKIDRISYEEMLEMAFSGSKVLQTRCVVMAMNYNVKVRVLSTFKEKTEDSGTILINNNEIMEKRLITGISQSKNEARITLSGMLDNPGLSADIFGSIADKGINADMIVQNVSQDNKTVNITFTVNVDDLNRTKLALEQNQKLLGYKSMLINDDISKISVIGVGMVSNAGVAHTMFKTLADEGVNISLISTSEIKISILIARSFGDKVIKSLHKAFDLGAVTI